ncbi:MAG: sulfatase-like hydrolase/transferase, partial [Bacteroidales bacterium]|nr:sulfatase-like hydrolase/transferase [Bacteroidales bacterium]
MSNNTTVKLLNRFRSYFILGVFFFVATLILRCFDYCLLAPLFSISGNPVLFFRCVLNDALWCGAIILLFSPLNYLLSRDSQSLSTLFFSIFFAVLFLFQIVLVIFAFNSGKLLDKEILMRPCSEIIFTIKSYGSLYLYIFLCGAIIFTYSALSIILVRKTGQRFKLFFAISVLLISLSVALLHISVKSYNRRGLTDRFTINRALYFLYDIIHYSIDSSEEEYNIKDFLPVFEAEYPLWEKVDPEYPFMRKDNTPDVLSPFFNTGEKRPNIVLVIVESLGRGISGKEAISGSFTPFLDSLANHSLYWENCITTTQRSFGILPSLLGSLPNGNTGFQFGDMPEHTSIVRLLNENQYKTNLFYAGYYGFDCVMDFMDLQDVDYYAAYYEQYENDPEKEKKGTEWGYHDAVMFNKSLEDPALQYDKNVFNVYVTVSTHGKLEIPEKDKYIKRAHVINQKLSQEQQKANRSKLNILASFVYTDDALRQFINGYKKRPDFENTIFIITGDHYVSTFGIRNPLDLYRVPLIIYSPLLKTSKQFQSLVSTLDVTPSLWTMLRNQYHLTAPEYIAWISDGLDTTQHFSSRKKVLLMQINRDTEEFVYNQFFYSYGSVYEINDNLELTESTEKIHRLTNKYKLFKTVHSYTYNKRKLFYNPFQPTYRLIIDKEMTYPYPEEFFNCLDRRKTNLDSLFSTVKIAASYKICFDTIFDHK